MPEDEGIDQSSETVFKPSGASAAGASRSVFLSYASADANTAYCVCQFLEAQGVACWMAPAEFLKDLSDGARVEGSAMAYFALGRKRDSDAALTQALKSYAGILEQPPKRPDRPRAGNCA